MKKKIEVEWTGSYPALCYGAWVLKIDGEDCSSLIPENLRSASMNTHRKYEQWHFEDWREVWEFYEDGLHEKEWIEENLSWLQNLPIGEDQHSDVFHAFNEKDWRRGSCGGCI